MALADAPPPYRTLVFDCDSTLAAMEGIEALASPSQAEEIARLTDAAMDGTVPLEEVFGRRLELLRPGRSDVERIGRLYVERRLRNVDALVATARALGKRVIVVSGGLLPAVRALARHLDVEEVHAVGVTFDEAGAYAGFDEDSRLARAGGKIDVLEKILEDEGARPLAFVGDGATDLEAGHLADRFVAFGGVLRREAVFRAAAVRCASADFAALAPLLFSPAELASAPPELSPPPTDP